MKNKKLLLLVADSYEDREFWYPKIRLEEEGIEITVAAAAQQVYHGAHGLPATPDISFDHIKPADYDGVVIPGGYAPDKLRTYKEVLELVKKYNKEKKLVAFICHAGWVPISAKILKGKMATGAKAIKDDMENAGVIWKDQAAVVDENLISSRTPDDLGEFCKAIIKFLNES